jgi:hypothetical protein
MNLYELGRDIGVLQTAQKELLSTSSKHEKRLTKLELRQAIIWRAMLLVIVACLTATGQLNRAQLAEVIAQALKKWLTGGLI